ncbi:MAG TPA: hypothetical protein VLB74_07635 [Flavobacterium sp.]|uniref:hypothetical protein n=1 Tax=Flavobacterium sp. TaxID=239 RepID=UPI002C626E84|nr:hypothetical protein [Flavobacterium sp.]HSD14503.1 hypothetical protein [Flavobacterium sp.]
MFSQKVLFLVSLIGGIIIALVGIHLKFTETIAGSYTFSKYGGVGYGTIDGNGALLVGISILLFSGWTYYEFKKERVDRIKRMEDEGKMERDARIKIILRRSKTDLNTFLYNRKEFYKKHKIDKQ